MTFQREQGRRMVLLVALFVTCAAAAAGQSSARPGGCVTTKPFSPQDAGLHAVILGEWRATCDGTRAVASAQHPARSRFPSVQHARTGSAVGPRLAERAPVLRGP